MKLSDVIDELVEERGLNRELLSSVISEGIHAAYSKRYPDLEFEVVHNKKTDELDVRVKKTVVARVDDESHQVSLKRARGLREDAKIGEDVLVPFELGIGRIEILRAKQVIANRIRTIESSIIYEEFINKKDTIVLGVMHKCERSGMTIKVGDTLAFLPKSLSISTDKCLVGYSIRALLKDVLKEPRNDNQLILDRASAEFVEKLFELEIPEVFERLVEIKKVVRAPGYKSKVAVLSHDDNIDPVGTCVGVGGVRIRPILKELGGEKIDVIPWSDSLETLVAQALKPAVVNRVELVGDDRAQVWLDDDQRSVAIGKLGQNIALASKLTGVAIDLMQARSSEQEVQETFESVLKEDVEIE